jgi:hypothetical protein
MPDLQTLRQKLADARQEVRNLTVMAMRPHISPARGQAVLSRPPPCPQPRADVDLYFRSHCCGPCLLLTRGPSLLFKQRKKRVRHEARARGI